MKQMVINKWHDGHICYSHPIKKKKKRSDHTSIGSDLPSVQEIPFPQHGALCLFFQAVLF